MSAMARASEEVEESNWKPMWSLTLRCGHVVTCGRFSERSPTQRRCVTCKRREKLRRKDQQKRERKAVGLDTFIFRLRNG